MKGKVLVFGGTTEGRELAAFLREARIPHVISVATEYGKEILEESGEKSFLVGRKNAEDIARIIKREDFEIVIDSTHPFAIAASKEIEKACENTKARYLRLKRDTFVSDESLGNVVICDTFEEAALELSKDEGNILLLTGSKDLDKITALLPDITKVYARVLPNAESLQKCLDAGLKGRQIIAMQGPFSTQMNVALIKELHASVILTKESGRTGGLSEKLEAARQCGAKAVVIRNPENMRDDENAYSEKEIIEYLKNEINYNYRTEANSYITLAGIGPGNADYYTSELNAALQKADIIFGAKSVIERLEDINAPKVAMYLGEEIHKYLAEHKEYMNPVVVFSGDISLCSGATKAKKYFENNDYKTTLISGISSVTLFLKHLGIGLEDVKIVSAHGRSCNVKGYANEEENLIILPSDVSHARDICEDIDNLTDRLVIGHELGTEEEKLIEYKDNKKSLLELSGKCLIYSHNSNASKLSVFADINDASFIRGKTPMTKSEIRALSLVKLGLSRKAVLYDIGAGTGSVSVEAALLSPDIKVYSIEKNEDALDLLRQNKKTFGVANMEIIPGTAPEALKALPDPTHVFVGGSSGNLKEIMDIVLEKNGDVRIVINCVTAETFVEVTGYIKQRKELLHEIIQLQVTRYKEAGNYHIADAQNPVYIVMLWRNEHGE